jgi:prepilin-type processing-associated H-X9-DG protein
MHGVTFGGAPFSISGGPNHPAEVFRFRDITDGLSNTLLAAELVQGAGDRDLRGFAWWAAGAGFSTYLAPNSPQPDVMPSGGYCDNSVPTNPPCTGWSNENPITTASRSRHPGGVNAARCDGSVRFISENIAINTWRALSTTQGAESIGNY